MAFVEAGTLGGVLADHHPRLLAHASRACALPVGPDDFGIDDAYVEASLVGERSSLRGRLRRRGHGG